MVPSPFHLHDYQQDVLGRVSDAFAHHRSVMLQMPTGTGKTVVLAAVVNDELRTKNEESTVWIVAHRRELVAQVEETLARFGIDTDGGGRVRVMSVQWLALHVGEMAVRPRLVIIDEAHHAQAATYRMLWDECPQARFLGLTATPCRMSGSGFTDLFDVLVTSWSIAEFVKKGYLSAFDYASIRSGSREQLLIDSLEKRGADGDYQVKELNAVFNRRQSIGRLYESVVKFAGDKKGIVYAISIDHAAKIAEYYSAQGLRAVAISSRTPAVERRQLVADFKSGRIQVLVNVDVFSEGFDCPDVEFVQLARPTLSLAKYLQQAGRGLRVAAGKSGCVFIDNVGLYRVFGLPTVAWDWQSMFRGDTSGRGCRQKSSPSEALAVERASVNETACDSCGLAADMQLVVSRDSLFDAISRCRDLPATVETVGGRMRACRDEVSGLWSLWRGRSRRITNAVYSAVWDIADDMAAVALAGCSDGALVDSAGNVVWRCGGCRTMRFARNNILVVTLSGGKEQYVDLCNMCVYDVRPEVKHYGNISLLKVGGIFYSRTKTRYISGRNIDSNYILRRRFYLAIFDASIPDEAVSSGVGSISSLNTFTTYSDVSLPSPYGGAVLFGGMCSRYVCIIDGDADSYYIICSHLSDGSIVVADPSGGYHHVAAGGVRKYIGRGNCREAIARIAEQADASARRMIREKEKQRRQKVADCGEAHPFRSGVKWGVRAGDRIVVPPVYRSVRPPVGQYCAVEKNYCQWGIIATDGKVLVEPRYQDVHIGAGGTATLTFVTGKTQKVKLRQ